MYEDKKTFGSLLTMNLYVHFSKAIPKSGSLNIATKFRLAPRLKKVYLAQSSRFPENLPAAAHMLKNQRQYTAQLRI